MKRRDFVSGLGVSTAVLMTPALGGASKPGATTHEHQGGGHSPLPGPLANAVVTFGQWRTDPPLDRYANPIVTPPDNIHNVLPHVVQIKAGGSVSFIISGLHQIIVYGPDVEPADISLANPVATTGVPAGVPLVNDANNRIYRGPDPSLLGTFDRVESVHFPHRGRYLVICGVLPHFTTGMYGFVNVLP